MENNDTKIKHSAYSDERKNYSYYKFIRNFLVIISSDDKSIIDVGSHDVDLISHLNCYKKISLDLCNPLQTQSVIPIKCDFFDYNTDEQFDIVCCFQVLEHIKDAASFAKKLLEIGKIAVVSVPYKWKRGATKTHIQDPVDEEKIIKWFNKEPIFLNVIQRRLLAVFTSSDDDQKLFSINNQQNFRDFYDFQHEHEPFLQLSYITKADYGRGDIDAAIAHARQAMQQRPENPMLGDILCAYLYKKEDLAEMETIAKDALTRQTQLDWPHIRLAQVANARGDIDAAIAHVRKAIELKPESSFYNKILNKYLKKQKILLANGAS